MSSPFGATEAFRDSGHKGLDIVAPAGTPVTAPQFEGFTVTNVVTGKERSQTKGDAGNYVKMQKTVGGKKVEITYMHLGDVGVKSGDVLQPGQVLGGVGNSGYTVGNTGVHLDVRVKVDGEYVNPIELPFLLANLEDPGPRYSSTFTSDMKNGSEVK